MDPALVNQNEKLRAKTRELRVQAICLRIDAADVFCNVAENELRWEPPERTWEALGKIRQSVREIRRHIEEPRAFDPATAAHLEHLLAGVEARADKIEAALNRSQSHPDSEDHSADD